MLLKMKVSRLKTIIFTIKQAIGIFLDIKPFEKNFEIMNIEIWFAIL